MSVVIFNAIKDGVRLFEYDDPCFIRLRAEEADALLGLLDLRNRIGCRNITSCALPEMKETIIDVKNNFDMRIRERLRPVYVEGRQRFGGLLREHLREELFRLGSMVVTASAMGATEIVWG